MYASKYNLVFDAGHKDQYLILNPLSGAMDLFDSRALHLLSNANEGNAQRALPDFFTYCNERGYLYDAPSGEEIRLKEIYERSSELHDSEPLRVEIYPTFLCNLRCTYCFQSHRMHGRATLIRPEVIDSMFHAISVYQDRLGKSQPPILTLFGGEPLLNRSKQREAIGRVLGLARDRGYRIRIITNGVHLGAYAGLLAKYPIDFIQVTLDGPREVHDRRRIFASGSGSFDRIVDSIDRAVEKSLRIVIRVNIDGDNISLLPQLAQFILRKGWLDKGVAVGVSPVDEFVPETEWCAEPTKIDTLKKLLNVKRDHKETEFMSISCRLAQFFEYIVDNGRLPFPMIKYCPATMGNQISLDYGGNFFVCCCMNACEADGSPQGRFHPAVEVNEDLLVRWKNRHVFQLSPCRECPLALLCGGGCTRLALSGCECGCGDLQDAVACPPMMNMQALQSLVDYYLPRILEAQANESRSPVKKRSSNL